jgi:prophage antirepressor-like protein
MTNHSDKENNMNDIVPFDFNGNTVRVVMVDDEPWFVARDVCDALEITDTHVAIRRLDDDEKGGCSVPTHGGSQKMTMVNESGLYSLIMVSRKPEAKAFKKWVTGTVLPSEPVGKLPCIRKTGGYIAKVARYRSRGREDGWGGYYPHPPLAVRDHCKGGRETRPPTSQG